MSWARQHLPEIVGAAIGLLVIGPIIAVPILAPSAHDLLRAARTPGFVDPGDQASLYSGRGAVLLGASEKSLLRIGQLEAAGDRVGIEEMLVDGDALLVPDGTLCRVIQSGDESHEVRVSAGGYRGRAGFVRSKDVVRPR